MGFDIHGINPKENVKREEYPTLTKYDKLEYEEKWKIFDEKPKEHDKYWKERDEFESKNAGIYFRNNCWWWRPLWDFCYNMTDVLSENDWEQGHTNSMHIISESKAVELGSQLMEMVSNGKVETYIKEYELSREAKKDEDKFWNSYPMSIENIEEFANFCLQSGGFEIG